MKQLIIFISLIMLLTVANTKSAEIIPVWNRTLEGEVQDMDFLKGQEEVLILVGEGSSGQIQRRNPENGDLVHSFPNPLSSVSKLVLTPDSLRFIHINGNGGLIRNLDEEFSVTSSFTATPIHDSIIVTFNNIVVDPIRPIAYVTTNAWDQRINNYVPYKKVIAYNYETGEHIKDLTPYGEYEYTAIEVSHDGKYLATLNDNKAYLKMWDLETMELIVNEPLFDINSDDWCRAEDIYFSKINPDLIYYSGLFTKSVNEERLSGIFSYNIDSKVKRRFVKNGIYSGNKMTFLGNETRVLNSSVWRVGVINLVSDELEYYGQPPENIYPGKVIYNEPMNYFIGMGGGNVSRFIYDNQSNVEDNYKEEIRISPNPTNSLVTLSTGCISSIKYQIFNSNGTSLINETINSQTNTINIDFNRYPSGVYFLTIQCDNESNTYKIIKEG